MAQANFSSTTSTRRLPVSMGLRSLRSMATPAPRRARAAEGEPGPGGEGRRDGQGLVADEDHEEAGAEEQRSGQLAVATGRDGQDADGAGDHRVPPGSAGHALGQGGTTEDGDDGAVGDPAAGADRASAEPGADEQQRHGRQVRLAGGDLGVGEAQPDAGRHRQAREQHAVEASPLDRHGQPDAAGDHHGVGERGGVVGGQPEPRGGGEERARHDGERPPAVDERAQADQDRRADASSPHRT